jgi:TPR repeat protein
MARAQTPACPGAAEDADAASLGRIARQLLTATPRDVAGAANCLEAAFAAGDPGAAVARGQLALSGSDGPADPTLAAAWFFRAAHAGSPQGYLEAGLAMAAGRGVPADPYWAYWTLGRALRLPGLSPEQTRAAQAASQQASAELTPAQRAALDANLDGKAAP